MPKKILLCDDEIHILRASEFKFSHAGFNVCCASNGEEAWERIQQELPDILVTDCQMPKLDGLGLIRRLREHDATLHLPVIMLTAKSFELATAELDEQWNVSAVVAKPFSPRELLSIVQNTLAAREANQPLAAQ